MPKNAGTPLPEGQDVPDAVARWLAVADYVFSYWPVMVAAIFLLLALLGVAWLALGLLAVRWQRHFSTPVADPEILELVDVVQAELSCTKRIEIRQADNLATAATVGWRRPVLLLPAAWKQWTPEQRRAIVAHELAHVKNDDFLSLVLGQLGAAIHFYNPLVHWLLGRLRLEQEWAADAAAARLLGGQRRYLSTIAEIALDRNEQMLMWPARSFLPTKNTFLRRIAMLRDNKLPEPQAAGLLRVFLISAVVVVGFCAAGLRGPAVEKQALADEPAQNIPEKTPSTAAIETKSDSVDEIDLSFLPPWANMFLIVRPQTALAIPELASWVKMNMESNSRLLQGQAMSALHQFTIVAGVGGYIIYQFDKPTEATVFLPQEDSVHVKMKEGKKLYETKKGFFLQIDDKTIIEAAAESLFDMYLSNTRGALPAWIPAEDMENAPEGSDSLGKR